MLIWSKKRAIKHYHWTNKKWLNLSSAGTNMLLRTQISCPVRNKTKKKWSILIQKIFLFISCKTLSPVVSLWHVKWRLQNTVVVNKYIIKFYVNFFNTGELCSLSSLISTVCYRGYHQRLNCCFCCKYTPVMAIFSLFSYIR